MKTIQVQLGDRSYPINVKPGLTKDIPSILSDNNHGQKWVIISQHRLMELFGFDLMANLKDSEFDMEFITIPAGEAAKSQPCDQPNDKTELRSINNNSCSGGWYRR